MPRELQTIRFSNPLAFAGLTGVVDFKNATIHGVSLITSGLTAEGHELEIDDVTVTQLHALAKDMTQVPVTLDHGGGISDVNGYLENFRMDGNKLRGDWHLLNTHKETVTMLERAERQPGTFGMSVAFKGDPKGVLVMGTRRARAEKLLSADCVTRPAANPEGMFSARERNPQIEELKSMIVRLSRGEEIEDQVDTREKDNAMNPNLSQNANEPTIADLLAAIQQGNQTVQALSGRIDQMQGVQDQLVTHINSSIEDQGGEEQGYSEQDVALLTQLNSMSDAQLEAFNQANGTQLTRDSINAEVSAYNASIDGGAGEEADLGGDLGGELGGGELAGAGVSGSAASGAGTTALSALQRKVIQLDAQLKARDRAEKKAFEDQQFSEIETNMTHLQAQRDKAIELAEKTVAENEALRTHLRTGTRPVKAGVADGIRMFSAGPDGELHEFQKRVQAIAAERKCSTGQAIRFASTENHALHMDWIQSQAGNRVINS